jgi:hypothetical protein
VLNVVPILFHAYQGNDLDDVMENLVEKLTLSIHKFEQSATKLESKLTESQCQPQIQRYLDTCRTTVTGLLNWSLSTQRYGLSCYRDDEGCGIVTL